MQQFVLLPVRGSSVPVRAESFLTQLASSNHEVTFFRAHIAGEADAAPIDMRVLDSIHENGTKLVELPVEEVSALRAAQPSLQVVPVVYFYPAIAPRPQLSASSLAGTAVGVGGSLSMRIVSAATGHGVAQAKVVAFTDFANRIGAQGITAPDGSVALTFGTAVTSVERLYVYPQGPFWGLLKRSLVIAPAVELKLRPIDLSSADVLRHFYGTSSDDAGRGVTVGILDTGIDLAHKDLTVAGGVNTVVGEDAKDFGDNGQGHGTHVAGIVAAHGQPPTGVRGMAPAVTLRSYRVFGHGGHGASNYSIAKAIDRAVTDGCDLLNLSLGGGSDDPATRAAIEDAFGQGVVVVAASGNDGRQPVSFPGADPQVIAVGAMGRVGTFPQDAVESGDVEAPFGDDPANFVAAFSNVGPQISLIAPGVGIVSTFPINSYAVMSGTSMACPCATGAAARLLAGQPHILAMARDAARADAITRLVLSSATSMNFGPLYEGQGMPKA